MKYLAIIALLSLFFCSSCSKKTINHSNQVGIEAPLPPPILELPLEEELGEIVFNRERDFTPSEMLVGKRICEALGHKRNVMHQYKDASFDILMEGKFTNCEDEVSTKEEEKKYTILNTGEAAPRFYSEQPGPYFQDIIFDNDDIFKKFCIEIVLNPTTINFYKNENVKLGMNFRRFQEKNEESSDESNEKEKKSQESNKDEDIVEWIKEERDEQGEFIVTQKNRISVNTKNNTTDLNFWGFEIKRERFIRCKSTNKFNYLMKKIIDIKMR